MRNIEIRTDTKEQFDRLMRCLKDIGRLKVDIKGLTNQVKSGCPWQDIKPSCHGCDVNCWQDIGVEIWEDGDVEWGYVEQKGYKGNLLGSWSLLDIMKDHVEKLNG